MTTLSDYTAQMSTRNDCKKFSIMNHLYICFTCSAACQI